MSRFISAVFAVLAGVAPAIAQESCSDPCPRGILEEIADGYYENHRWPYPYSYADQQAVRDPFVIMVQNGWRRQNLLADYHFLRRPDSSTRPDRRPSAESPKRSRRSTA